MTHVQTVAAPPIAGPKYATALLSLAVLLLTSLTAALAGPVTLVVLIQLGLILLGGVVTYIVPLVDGPWAGALKVGIGVVAAVLSAIIPLLAGAHWTTQNTLIVALAAVNALATHLGVAIRKAPIDAGTAAAGTVSVLTTVTPALTAASQAVPASTTSGPAPAPSDADEAAVRASLTSLLGTIQDGSNS